MLAELLLIFRRVTKSCGNVVCSLYTASFTAFPFTHDNRMGKTELVIIRNMNFT